MKLTHPNDFKEDRWIWVKIDEDYAKKHFPYLIGWCPAWITLKRFFTTQNQNIWVNLDKI